MCDDINCCQCYKTKEYAFAFWDDLEENERWGKLEMAVDATKKQVITYNGEIISAFFHAHSGGKTENVSTVWGGADLPYLQSVETSGEDGYTQYSSTVTLTKEETLAKIREKYPETVIDWNVENPVSITEYTESGRVKTIQFGNTSISGVEARTIFGLKSAKFNIEIGESVTFNVVGYGHGVGLSQTGADSMAKTGASAEQIINHYYTGVKIENI